MEKEGKFKEIQRLKSIKSNKISDENRSINSTKYDSLNNILHTISKTQSQNHFHNLNRKNNNFIQALRMIQGKSFINNTKTHMSEISETNANNSKEEKVINYLHNPITKNVTKEGNQLKVSFHKQFTTSINVPYKLNTIFQTFLLNIVEIEDDEDDEIIIPSIQEKRFTKGSVYNYKHNQPNKASTADHTQNNNESFSSRPSPKVKPFSLQIIDDLDELKEVNVSDYKTSIKGRFPMDNNQINRDTEIFIADSLMSSERYNHINFNRRLFTSLEDKFSIDKSQTEKLLSFKQRTTEKKIPPKYYRRELIDSFGSSKSFKMNQKNINTNLINQFNKCDNNSNNINNLNATIKIKGNQIEECSNTVNDNVISINNVNNISIEAEMIDFITDNDSYDSDTNKKNIKNNNTHKKDFNGLTPIRNLDIDIIEDSMTCNYITPIEKRKKFKLPIADSNLERNSSMSSKLFKRMPTVKSTDNVSKDEEVETVYDLDFINNLLSRDSHYKCKADYIINHPKLKWSYRTTLVDWLMEISEEFAFKRDTFHYAINYIDRYLSKKSDCEKKFLQLLGITCLGIAAKIEEVQIPKLIEYAKATDESFTDVEIIETEKKILKTLQWEIIPITLNTWMNWYMCQWDLFLDTFDEMVLKLNGAYSNENVVYFKRSDDRAYYNFRKIAQIIDLCQLSESNLNYNSRSLVACGILIVLILNYDLPLIDVMTLDQLDFNFYHSLLQKPKQYIEVYKDFLKQSFNFDWEDPKFIRSMVFVGKFIKYNFKYEVPLVYQVSSNEIENGNYEDFVSFQTYNEQNLGYLEMISKS